MGFYSAKTDIAFRQQKEAERQRRMSNSPGRRLLNASVDQLPKLLGKLAVDAAQYGLFGGKEELASVQGHRLKEQKYRLWEMGKESPSQRALFERLHGEAYDPTKPPEGFGSWVDGGRKMPTSPTDGIRPPTQGNSMLSTRSGMGGRDLMVPKSDYEKAKAAGTVKDDMGLGDLITKAESARKKMGKEPVSLPEPESLMKDGKELTRVTEAEYDAMRPGERASEGAPERAPRRKPLSVMEQAAQEAEKMYPNIFGTPYASDMKKRATLAKERAKVLETEDRKELDAFKADVGARFEFFNKTAKKMTAEDRIAFKKKFTKDLVEASARLRDRNLEKGLMHVSSAYNAALPNEAAEFERAVLSSPNGGRVEDITVFGARPGPRTYVKIPSPRSVEGAIETNSLAILREEKNLIRLDRDIARLETKLKATDITSAQKKSVSATIKGLKEERAGTLSTMQEASQQIKNAMSRPDIKVDPAVKTQEVTGLGPVTLSRFEGKKAGELDPSRRRKRASDDWKNVVSADGGDKNARSALVDKVKKSFGADSAAFKAIDPKYLRSLEWWKDSTNEEKVDFMVNRLAESGVTPEGLRGGRSRAVVQEEKKAVAANVVADPQLLKEAPITEGQKSQAIAGEFSGGVLDDLYIFGTQKGVSASTPMTSFDEAKARHDWLTKEQWKEISSKPKERDFFLAAQKNTLTSYGSFRKAFKLKRGQ